MSRTAPARQSLVCPECGSRYGEDVRFCSRCRLPLVLDAASPEISDRHQRARKIKPQLAEGPLVRVAGARNQPEAEFIQSLLLEEGVPSLLRRTAGFDVPDFLAGGPRDVMVPSSGADVARQTLLAAELVGGEQASSRPVAAWRLLVGLLIALAAGALVVWALAQAIR